MFHLILTTKIIYSPEDIFTSEKRRILIRVLHIKTTKSMCVLVYLLVGKKKYLVVFELLFAEASYFITHGKDQSSAKETIRN